METNVEMTGVGVDAGTALLDQVETWLQTLAQPQQPLLWRYRGSGNSPVPSIARLAELLVNGLPRAGDWAVLEPVGGQRWAQTMRVHDGWIVEVDGAGLAEPMARRVYELGSRGKEEDRRLNLAPGGRLTATFLDGEAIDTAEATARVMWVWMKGLVVDGYALREVHHGVD